MKRLKNIFENFILILFGIAFSMMVIAFCGMTYFFFRFWFSHYTFNP